MTHAKMRGPGTLPDSKETTIKLPSQETRRKRVYDKVAVIESDEAFGVSLDGRSLHTPKRTKLETPSRALADAIAVEWDEQGEFINPETMLLTKLLNTQLDRIAPDRSTIVSGLLSYFDSDLLCYRAERPETLVARQHAVWQPVLDWLSQTHGIELSVRSGLMPLSQSAEAREKAETVLSGYSNTGLTGVQGVAGLTSSLSLGIALVGKKLSGAEAAAAASLDESWQMEKWGDDDEALDRIADLASEILAVERFLNLSET